MGEKMIESDILPFRMYGNLYFVGSTKVSVHIIKTESGLVMIDTGYPEMYEQILDSMKKMSLDPEDICAIFHTHGHIDHYGCTKQFKEISGAKTYISRIDNDIVNGTYDLSCAKEIGRKVLEPFDCDVLLEDGDIFTFGKTKMRCVLTPGHTKGVMSFFVNIEEGENSIIAGMHGGVGMNTLNREYLEKNSLSFDCRKQFTDGLLSLKKEHVDLVMGNHPHQNNTEEKLKKVMSGISIVDPTEWERFLSLTEERLSELLRKEEQENAH